MKVKLEINPKYTEPEVHVCGDRDGKEIRRIFGAVKTAVDARLVAYDGEETVMVPCSDIVRIYTQNKKVYLTAESRQYRLHDRLYELEERLDGGQFIRISNSEIVNVHKILRMDTGLTGTIRMYLKGGEETYVSRRYVPRIKQALGI